MEGIRSFEFNSNQQCEEKRYYEIGITFYSEKNERDFLCDISKAFCDEFKVSALLHDLDTDINHYKEYFTSTTFWIYEKNPSQPFITCSVLDPQAWEAVINNWGYYTLNAYLYWSKYGIEFKKSLMDTSDYFFMNFSALTIRQVLDLSLEIRVSNEMIPKMWDVLKKWSIY